MTPLPELKRGRGPIGALATPPVNLLVCFAVREEARFFAACRQTSGDKGRPPRTQAWLTGMGKTSAAESIRSAIRHCQPARVVSAGFAGGLDPSLRCGQVLFEEDDGAGFAAPLRNQGAAPGRFHCHERVAVTASEKALLWQSTGAGAVEMESSAIRAVCRELNIPSATVRVISDDALQDLPLDFNALMTRDGRIDFLRLFWTIARHPGRIPALIEFQRQTTTAARRLGAALDRLIE